MPSATQMPAAKHCPWMTAATEHSPEVPLLQSTEMSAENIADDIADDMAAAAASGVPTTSMMWRRLGDRESFKKNYEPNAGNRRGYLVCAEVMLAGHGNCGCYRGHHPQEIYWFLQHSDVEHGYYPVHHSKYGLMEKQLWEQLPGLQRGVDFVVCAHKQPSYGALGSGDCNATEHAMQQSMRLRLVSLLQSMAGN